MTDPRIQMAWSIAFEREFNEQYRNCVRMTQDPATKCMVFVDIPIDTNVCRIAGDRAAAACTEALEKAPR